MKFKLLSASVLGSLLFSGAVAAKSPDWNMVEFGYVQADIDDFNSDPDGFSVFGSVLISDNVFISGDFTSVSDEVFGTDIEVSQTSVGFGYRHELSASTDFYGVVSYESVEAATSFASDDENGYGLTIGVRSRLTDSFELNGSIGYVRIEDESETAYGVSGYYYFTDNIAIGASYTIADDVNMLGASVRFAF